MKTKERQGPWRNTSKHVEMNEGKLDQDGMLA